MILSSLRLQWISDSKGYGLVATQPIPKGTITFVQDGLDIVVPPSLVANYPATLRTYIDRYSFEGPDGSHIISWDHGKYMNHCCFANTLTTGYGFEIAIRDISIGEEVTDDYRIFTTDHHLLMSCDKENCQGGNLNTQNNTALIQRWDSQIREALLVINNIEQELLPLVPTEDHERLKSYLNGTARYESVARQLPPPKPSAIPLGL